MAVRRSCNPGNIRVRLDVSGGEYLEYRIPLADSNVQYVLSSGEDGRLFDNTDCPAGCVFRWPSPTDPPGPGEARHTLSMQFFGNENLTYEVDRKSSTGTELEVVKRCTFRNEGSPDDYFEVLRVFVS